MKKKGMAIPIVLIFATIMGIVSLFLFKSAKNYNRQNLTSFAQLQSYFIARAGVEHAMLKIKYLNRELYDAICLSQGRNPLFDFSQIQSTEIDQPKLAIESYNPGPIFLYKLNEFSERKGVFTTNFNELDENRAKHNRWVNTFLSDLISEPNDNPNKTNKVLDIKETVQNQMKGKMIDPFNNAQYQVIDIGVSASEVKEDKGKVDNNVVVEFTVKSVLETSRNEPFDYEIKKTVRVSRD